jgi:hypothetical protein
MIRTVSQPGGQNPCSVLEQETIQNLGLTTLLAEMDAGPNAQPGHDLDRRCH